MLKRNVLLSICLVSQCALLLYAFVPSSILFVNETYELQNTTQEQEGIKYQFKGSKEYPYEDHTIHRKLSFLKYSQPQDDFSAKPLKTYKNFEDIRHWATTATEQDLKEYPDLRKIKDGLMSMKIKRCKDDTILLESRIYYPDKTLCGGGITRYTSQGEIKSYELKAEFLEVPFEKYGESLCELEMI